MLQGRPARQEASSRCSRSRTLLYASCLDSISLHSSCREAAGSPGVTAPHRDGDRDGDGEGSHSVPGELEGAGGVCPVRETRRQRRVPASRCREGRIWGTRTPPRDTQGQP